MRLFFGVLFRIAVPMPQLSDECCHCKIEKHRFALCCIGSVGAVAFVCFGARLNWLVGKKPPIRPVLKHGPRSSVGTRVVDVVH
ncbi:hypothetical protein T4E_11666 [Trichinella pseudospiralis]|uniref:Transmembrane protein n=1 Tax=Trichinella pseudospiralis TaxID=6337 RepID=A0A0V0XEV5_TRIPS|nr:hypothetical protein T4E_11666 [Trichinella pseudospiralis]